MATYTVSFEVDIPDDAPPDDAEEFLRFEIGDTAQMQRENALARYDLRSLPIRNFKVR